jgi:hypothetical protein
LLKTRRQNDIIALDSQLFQYTQEV